MPVSVCILNYKSSRLLSELIAKHFADLKSGFYRLSEKIML